MAAGLLQQPAGLGWHFEAWPWQLLQQFKRQRNMTGSKSVAAK
jgi:hypothetical protein